MTLARSGIKHEADYDPWKHTCIAAIVPTAHRRRRSVSVRFEHYGDRVGLAEGSRWPAMWSLRAVQLLSICIRGVACFGGFSIRWRAGPDPDPGSPSRRARGSFARALHCRGRLWFMVKVH